MAASLSTPQEKPVAPLPSLGETIETSEHSKRSQTAEAVEDIVFGSTAGAIGKIFEYPFDTVKVRLQSQSHSVYSGPLDCFRKAVRADGVIRGLYRGLSAPVVGAAVETSSLFFSYRLSQDFLLFSTYSYHETRENLPLDALLIAGAMSGAFTSLALTPIELVKCQMQVPLSPGSIQGPGVMAVMGNILRHNGPLGFWHGQLGTLIREAGGSAAWFGSYEGVKKLFKDQNLRQQESSIATSETSSEQAEPQLHVVQRLIAGAGAGVAYNFAFYPADTIKSRMQTEQVGPIKAGIAPNLEHAPARAAAAVAKSGAGGNSAKVTGLKQAPPNFWNTSRVVWREAGLKGLYRGCGITLARSSISSPIIFGIYEALKDWSDS